MEVKKRIYTVDNIEDEFATVETPESKIVIVPVELLPEGIEEFDLMEIVDHRFEYLAQETNARKCFIAQRFEELWEDVEEENNQDS